MPRPIHLTPIALALGLGACAQIDAGLDRMAGAPSGQDPGACGAGTRQELVGQPVSVLDASALPEGTRVLFPGMSATQDFRPDRLNITVGISDDVERVYCG